MNISNHDNLEDEITNPNEEKADKQLEIIISLADNNSEKSYSKTLKAFDDKFVSKKELIFEVSSCDEESRDQNSKNTDTIKTNSEPDYHTKQTQTEDILLQKYLEKLEQVEELMNNVKPEEITEIQTFIQNILDSGNSNSQISNISHRYSFTKKKGSLKRSFTGKFLADEQIKKNISSTPEISPRVLSPVMSSSKETKQQVADLMTSIIYCNNTLQQKQKELLLLEDQLKKKIKLLKLVSKKKLFRNIKETDDSFLEIRRHSERGEQAIPKNVLEVKMAKRGTVGIINESESNSPWDEGYEIGYDDGKIQGYLKAIEKINESEEFNQIGSDFEEADPAPLTRKKSDKIKYFTKFLEFNFHVPIKTRPKKIHPGPIILNKFLTKPLHNIKMRATLSRKNLNRILVMIYNTAIQKITIEGNTTLVEVAYDEFYGRYGLKSTCDKKFLEFIASIISNSEYIRCLMFMRLLRIGEILSTYSYSKDSLVLYLSCLSFINNSKLGIYFASDDEDKIMIPAIRMQDCIKEKLDTYADRTILSSISNKIERKIVPDPRKINPGGLIELEIGLEIILDTYERYIEHG